MIEIMNYCINNNIIKNIKTGVAILMGLVGVIDGYKLNTIVNGDEPNGLVFDDLYWN